MSEGKAKKASGMTASEILDAEIDRLREAQAKRGSDPDPSLSCTICSLVQAREAIRASG